MSRRCKYRLRWGEERPAKYRQAMKLNVGEAWKKPVDPDDPRESGELYWRRQARLEAQEAGEEWAQDDAVDSPEDYENLKKELEAWSRNPDNPDYKPISAIEPWRASEPESKE